MEFSPEFAENVRRFATKHLIERNVPIHDIVQYHSKDLIRYLIQYKYNIHELIPYIDYVTFDMIMACIPSIPFANCKAMLEKHLTKSSNDLNVIIAVEDFSLLGYCYMYNRNDLIDIFVEYVDVNLLDNNGNNVLASVYFKFRLYNFVDPYGLLKFTQLMIKYGLDIEQQNIYGHDALYYAKNYAPNVVSYLQNYHDNILPLKKVYNIVQVIATDHLHDLLLSYLNDLII
jgi:hypothetical protein